MPVTSWPKGMGTLLTIRCLFWCIVYLQLKDMFWEAAPPGVLSLGIVPLGKHRPRLGRRLGSQKKS